MTTSSIATGVKKTLHLSPEDNQRLSLLCGPFDENIKYLEKRLLVRINRRGALFSISSTDDSRAQACLNILMHLYRDTEHSPDISLEKVQLYIQEAAQELVTSQPMNDIHAVIKTPKLQVKARNQNQILYLQRVKQHDINFGIGPAGTGKTYLAVACAVEALQKEEVKRILLVRPAVEAGEKLGFLPGDLAQKVDPYLRPLYDALYDMLGFEQVARLIEKNVIEIAPLAFMRGRTLNNAFIILDESQNTTPEQMKMFLTRIGFGSTAII
ncbi:ATP-binding protein, partial [Oleiphilus sp. HI0009]